MAKWFKSFSGGQFFIFLLNDHIQIARKMKVFHQIMGHINRANSIKDLIFRFAHLLSYFWVILSMIDELVEGQSSSSSKIGPWVAGLKPELNPIFVYDLGLEFFSSEQFPKMSESVIKIMGIFWNLLISLFFEGVVGLQLLFGQVHLGSGVLFPG